MPSGRRPLSSPRHTGLHPGPNGENAIVRLTAPVSGVYRVAAYFEGLDYFGTTTDVAVLETLHDVSPSSQLTVFAGNVNGFSVNGYGSWGTSPTQSYTGLLSVPRGDTVDFTIGDGTDGNYNNDTTGLQVQIDLCTTGSLIPPNCLR